MNPFRPGVGLRPSFLAGREPQLEQFRALLTRAGSVPMNIRLTGLRGVGKTVLLAEFERQAESLGWRTSSLEFEPRHNDEQELIRAIGMACARTFGETRGPRSKRRRVEIGASPFPIKLIREEEAGEPQELGPVLKDAVDRARSSGRQGLILLIDEGHVVRDDAAVNGEHPLAHLLSAVTGLQRREEPIALVMAGLPPLAANLVRARTYIERAFRGMTAGQLAEADAAQALLRPLDGAPFRASADLAVQVHRDARGYPYFIQLWGSALWDAAERDQLITLDGHVLDRIRPKIYEQLDEDFYGPRVATLSRAERALIGVMGRAGAPPYRSEDLARLAKKSPQAVQATLRRLSNDGVVFRSAPGVHDFAVPEFYNYLLRLRLTGSLP